MEYLERDYIKIRLMSYLCFINFFKKRGGVKRLSEILFSGTQMS